MTLANGSAEIIDALGLKSIIVGRDIASTDASLKDIPILTSGHQVVAEKIIATRPDLVIIDSSVGPAQALQDIADAGITVKSIDEAWSLDDISIKVAQISALLGIEKSGSMLNFKIKNAISASRDVLQGSPRIAFLYLRGGSSIYLIGGKGSGADSLLQAIGAVDVGAQKIAQPFTALTSESFSEMSPDLILVMRKGLESVGGIDGLVSLPGVAQTPAGKNRSVVAVDDSLLLSFGPRTPALLGQLAEGINKEISR